MSSPRIIYTPRPDAAPETERNALAGVYRLVIDRAMKNAPGMTSTKGDDAKERSDNDSSARTIIPDR